jgi:undecaprenyl diphosphate synthase
MTDTLNTSVVPVHLGLILDGNRRWARSQGLPTLEGHRKGYDNLKTIARHAFESGVQYVSAYIFSTENWTRAKEEVDYLMNLAIKIASKDAAELIKENIKIVVLGIEDKLDTKLVEMWRRNEEDSKNNTGGTLALCFNYGGLREISDAVKQVVAKGTKAEDISEEMITQNLYHPEVPPVDLMIRTSGEQRISNFMIWRIAYAELYFTGKHWPAFTPADLDIALAEYKKRQRRYGK